jgi:hypothetical protein
VATAVGVTCVVAVGTCVGVLVGVGVIGACLLHPPSETDVATKAIAVNKSSVAESVPGGLCRAVLFDFRNPLSSYWDRREDTVKGGICQTRS